LTEHTKDLDLTGALHGIRVLELGGLGPVPFAGMILADHGADVIRLDRRRAVGGDGLPAEGGPLTRGKRSVAVDLKRPAGAQIARRLAEQSDCVLEGFRPGVAERLGLGPEELRAANPRLIYARVTGWGQDGGYAQLPGHDINYVALAGVLSAIGTPEGPPVPPLNLVGDFGGGGLLAAFGIAAALLERNSSGQGQTIDVAMVDGIALLSTMIHAQRAAGKWSDERGANVIDGGAPFYAVYDTADGKAIATGAGEPAFYADLIAGLGLDGDNGLPDQLDQAAWPSMKARFAEIFRSRTRDAWLKQFAGTQACVTPVLGLDEVSEDPHLAGRGTFISHHGVIQPAPAPRFSRSPAGPVGDPAEPAEQTDAVLSELGLTSDEISELHAAGVVGPEL
jgi:alpha-methylacyl-CoA racemase